MIVERLEKRPLCEEDYTDFAFLHKGFFCLSQGYDAF